ncbi:MAG: type II secretion system protein GspL [Woeseiaceae bacterium]|nr:type II secretion system protein GspL [Woeseiaceae bacterium]
MSEYLVIRPGPDPETSANWIVVDGDGTRRGPVATGPLSQAALEATEREVIVLVPATEVLTTTVELPVKSGARLLAALPYALEEQLADDVETLHFAAGQRREDGRIPAAVVSLGNMEHWQALLDTAGLTPARIVPENHGLARIPGTMSMLVESDQVLFNDGDGIEVALQGVSPAEVLDIVGAIGAGDGDAPRHLLVFCAPGLDEQYREDWAVLRDRLASVDLNVLEDGALPRLAVTVAAGHGINLLQGRFSRQGDLGQVLRPWRHAALLLLTLGLVLVAGKAVDTYRLARDEAALQARFTEEYREIRPDDTREIVDPLSVVNSLRRGLGGPVARQVFLPSLEQLGRALAQSQGAEVEAISYRAGVIDVRLTAPDVPTLDNIQRQVSASGRFTASIQSTDQVGDKVSSRIQIRETGA